MCVEIVDKLRQSETSQWFRTLYGKFRCPYLNAVGLSKRMAWGRLWAGPIFLKLILLGDTQQQGRNLLNYINIIVTRKIQ